MNLAIIPARGGSKRIPEKNIRSFAGKPMIAHSIEIALSSDLFDHVVVSTDDEKISEIAIRYGAEVPFRRPAELSDDWTPTIPVISHAIQWYQRQGKPVDYACCIYATAPFIQLRDLKMGYDLMRERNAAYAFTVTRYAHPIQRALIIEDAGGVQPLYPEHRMTRSQDLPQTFHDAGQFYWGAAQAFLKGLPFYDSHSVPVILPHYLAQDIDTWEDWQQAELLYKVLPELLAQEEKSREAII
jgi:pseudaminic acid cytidylyltransferase